MNPKRIALDANILLRAVFGRRVRQLFKTYETSVAFYAPDACFAEAQRYIPVISARRDFDLGDGYALLADLAQIVQIVDSTLYEEHESAAKARIGRRDVNDWPVIAIALLLNCPVWTEDRDFFGTGIATWTTQTIELYLRDA